MKILIIGCHGFIGQYIVQYYLRQGYEVRGCDLYDIVGVKSYHFTQISRLSPEFDRLFIGSQYDVCINASGSGNVSLSVSNPFADFEANTLDTVKVLESIRLYNPTCKYLHISSAAVYGNPASLPISESAACMPLSPYGWHKLMAEQVCNEYHSLYKIPIAIVRPFSIYGPGLKKQLFWDTYQKYLQSPLTIELWGTGKESRDFIYIEDVVSSFFTILNKAPLKAEVYNIASGIETTIADVINMLFEYMPTPPAVTFNNKTREGDPLNWRADISAMQKLGIVSSTDLRDGVQKLANWLQTEA